MKRLQRSFLMLVTAVLACGCAAGDDAVRVAARYAQRLAQASRTGDEIARILASRNNAALTRSSERIERISARFAASDEVDRALQSLLWNVGCDVVSGSVAPTQESVTRMLAVRAIEFGLEFTGDAAQAAGGAVLDSFGRNHGFERNDAAEACARIPKSGL